MPNEFVKPDSLYRAQLAERLGPGAVANLGARPIPADAATPGRRRARAGAGRARPRRPPGRSPLRNGWLDVATVGSWPARGSGRPGGAGSVLPDPRRRSSAWA